MSPEQTLRTPAYLGMIMMGALSPDHAGLSMDKQDMSRYPCIDKWRKNRDSLKRNLNQVM